MANRGFKNLSPALRQVLTAASEAANRARHGFTGTEHLLLALLRSRDGVPKRLLVALGVDIPGLAAAVTAAATAGALPNESSKQGSSFGAPFTTRAHRAMELAQREAAEEPQSRLTPEHLLLGIVAEGGGVAARALREQGVTLNSARAAAGRAVLDAMPWEFRPMIDDTSNRSIYEQIIDQAQE